jgi:hypothetical protein
MREWRSAQRAAGLCLGCKQRPELGRVLCTKHLARHAQYDRERRARRKASGLCVLCAAPSDGMYLCMAHRLSEYRRQQRDYANRPERRLTVLRAHIRHDSARRAAKLKELLNE